MSERFKNDASAKESAVPAGSSGTAEASTMQAVARDTPGSVCRTEESVEMAVEVVDSGSGDPVASAVNSTCDGDGDEEKERQELDIDTTVAGREEQCCGMECETEFCHVSDEVVCDSALTDDDDDEDVDQERPCWTFLSDEVGEDCSSMSMSSWIF